MIAECISTFSAAVTDNFSRYARFPQLVPVGIVSIDLDSSGCQN